MYVLENFLMAAAGLVDFLFTVYMWVIIGRVVISWVNADPYNPVVRFIFDITEPPLRKIRSFVPLSMGGIDFSPMILIVGLMFLQSFLVPTVRQLAMSM